MIIIKETPKADVVVAIDTEINNVNSIKDTLVLINDMSDEAIKNMEAYIQRNAVLKGIESQLKRSLSPRADLLGSIRYAADTLAIWLPKLRELIVKGNTKIYDSETITFKEKGILDSISSVDFWTRYAVTVLDILLTDEEHLNKYLQKADLTFFTDTAKYFSHLTVRFNGAPIELIKMIEALSEETYDEASASIIEAQLGAGAVSVEKGLVPHHLNPLFWWRWFKMKRDVDTIQTESERIKLLAMKIARLNGRLNGSEDPALERQIEVYQDEIIKKRGKIVEIESRYKPGAK